ncbi:Intracellular proteinase inhibitor [Bacillus sp. THAF10]|uniref:BsuPI-related putative proteinase inhibitor n=1 Tax=Bacillus sp. THAF10 TaxID=2587848 RepID=UPI001267EE5A|nr:BsuPI-related putative proteinase inhibitor [Bacillus sp. THAF10]QFT90884.1 Intracellular proteinase inhibitor [Bacillus sp. THAF10]
MALEASLSYSESGPDSVMLHFVVENTGGKSEMVTFRSGQRYDYILYRDGVKVEQFSEGKMFIMIYEEIAVSPGQELSFDIPLKDLEPGEYKVKVWLADSAWPGARETLEFEI